jgi:NADH:ubiquinone oxidoreductase subunit F (NADH-binding)/NADH:ubiquinone oxidoreductase subunit E
MGQKGNRRRKNQQKGRALDENALLEIKQLLGPAPHPRDMLIEYLHAIQDMYNCLHARHLRALAEEMRLSQVEIYEVASFYDHFDIVKEDEAEPAPLTIRVCDSISCMMAGCEQLISDLEAGSNPDEVRIVRAPCMGGCDVAPAVRVGNREIGNATAAAILPMVGGSTEALEPLLPEYVNFDRYTQMGGYDSLLKIRAGIPGRGMDFDSMLELLDKSGLRGLGGAGFPAHMKWKFVRSYDAPRLMTINGDEGEPGTFKDRYFLERDPHRLFEGALIAAHFVEAERIYLYMRDEYPAVLEILAREIVALETAGTIAPGFIELRRGAGAYICGEESAMIESIEGKRGIPRHRPPFIAETGLFSKPTLNHNVETLWWIRDIIEQGPEWFAQRGKDGHPGIRSWSVSGRVKNPGVKLAPAGVSVRELIDDYCGGMADGHSFKAYLPGGASGGILPASMDDLALDFGEPLASHGAFVGSHAVVILSDQDNIKEAVLNLLKFFAHESCGQCTPCRGGTEKMVTLLSSGDPLDEVAIRDLEQVMRDASICGLGQAAPNPVNHLLVHFREDL